MQKRFILALALAIPASAFGFSSQDKALDVSRAFAEQKTRIHADLADGETYSEISQQDIASVKGALERISIKLEQPGGLEGMNDASKAALFNDQELVNNLLTKAGKDSRVVCVREKKLGSHRTTSNCMTVGERARRSEDSQKAMRDNMGLKMPPPGG